MTSRLDVALVERGLAPTRTQAQALVKAGRVLVDGRPVTRPALPVPPRSVLSIADLDEATDADWIARGWVGRGAVKLDHALQVWAVDGLRVDGRRCLDVGASTGGFTQVLLEHGAATVLALDVGHGQLDPRLRKDARVVDRPGTNLRDVRAEDLGGVFDVVVADLSFISLTLVLPVLEALARPGADLVLLVKPQFEVGRQALGRGGVVRSPEARREVLLRLDGQARAAGLAPVDLLRSPLTGTHGNVEILWWLRRPGPGMMNCGREPAVLAARAAAVAGGPRSGRADRPADRPASRGDSTGDSPEEDRS